MPQDPQGKSKKKEQPKPAQFFMDGFQQAMADAMAAAQSQEKHELELVKGQQDIQRQNLQITAQDIKNRTEVAKAEAGGLATRVDDAAVLRSDIQGPQPTPGGEPLSVGGALAANILKNVNANGDPATLSLNEGQNIRTRHLNDLSSQLAQAVKEFSETKQSEFSSIPAAGLLALPFNLIGGILDIAGVEGAARLGENIFGATPSAMQRAQFIGELIYRMSPSERAEMNDRLDRERLNATPLQRLNARNLPGTARTASSNRGVDLAIAEDNLMERKVAEEFEVGDSDAIAKVMLNSFQALEQIALESAHGEITPEQARIRADLAAKSLDNAAAEYINSGGSRASLEDQLNRLEALYAERQAQLIQELSMNTGGKADISVQLNVVTERLHQMENFRNSVVGALPGPALPVGQQVPAGDIPEEGFGPLQGENFGAIPELFGSILEQAFPRGNTATNEAAKNPTKAPPIREQR